METLSRRARPKINLFLHVTGRRSDGYHLLDSLVCFAETGDVVRAEAADRLSLNMTGPFSAGLEAGEGNLVQRAAQAVQNWARAAGKAPAGAALHLDKRLPVASGIGGGSADAAAALSVLRDLWQLDIPDDALGRIALGLGADVPVCIDSRARVMRGIGEVLGPPLTLPPTWIVLVNPLREVSTAAVFSALDLSAPPPSPALPPSFADTAELGAWLAAETRNDLEAPARALAPELDAVLGVLHGCTGARLVRMSGSGATCFALFGGKADAVSAAASVGAAHPQWWVEAAALAA